MNRFRRSRFLIFCCFESPPCANGPSYPISSKTELERFDLTLSHVSDLVSRSVHCWDVRVVGPGSADLHCTGDGGPSTSISVSALLFWSSSSFPVSAEYDLPLVDPSSKIWHRIDPCPSDAISKNSHLLGSVRFTAVPRASSPSRLRGVTVGRCSTTFVPGGAILCKCSTLFCGWAGDSGSDRFLFGEVGVAEPVWGLSGGGALHA